MSGVVERWLKGNAPGRGKSHSAINCTLGKADNHDEEMQTNSAAVQALPVQNYGTPC